MMDKKNKEKKVTPVNENLIIDDSSRYVKNFNKEYEIFANSSDSKRLEAGIKAAIVVATEFDFTNENIKDKKSEYIDFAREMLYEASSKPHFNADAMIFLIRALYGQTNLAYSHQGEHKKNNIEDGNEWVDYLERNTKNRTLKAYALTLRGYQYIVNGDILDMTVKQRLNKTEKDLIYATKWDEENYLAFFALGLLYTDKENTKYSIEKAISNFNKVLELEYEDTFLDNYLSQEEKEHFMSNARKKVDSLKAL